MAKKKLLLLDAAVSIFVTVDPGVEKALDAFMDARYKVRDVHQAPEVM